jgi:hypothetical protein
MSRSLGIISGAFALRSHAFALVGHVVFSFFGCPFGVSHCCKSALGPFNPGPAQIGEPSAFLFCAPDGPV